MNISVFKRLRPSASLIVASIALIVALGGSAYAAAGGRVGSDGAIHGCVDRQGRLALVKPGRRCPRGRSALTWNQAGRSGSVGASGTHGAQGDRGPQGSTGPTGPRFSPRRVPPPKAPLS